MKSVAILSCLLCPLALQAAQTQKPTQTAHASSHDLQLTVNVQRERNLLKHYTLGCLYKNFLWAQELMQITSAGIAEEKKLAKHPAQRTKK